LFKPWKCIPEDLKIFYNKKVVKDLQNLLSIFLIKAPRTTNQLEDKFSGAQ